MADHVGPAKRSEIMSAVQSKDTKPEMAVRRTIHAMGFRYALHRADLPGRPDLVFPSRGKVIFVHGCFWHRHTRCKYATTPKTRTEYWEAKFEANIERDRRNRRELKRLGWDVFTVWQCQLKDLPKLTERLNDFLSS